PVLPLSSIGMGPRGVSFRVPMLLEQIRTICSEFPAFPAQPTYGLLAIPRQVPPVHRRSPSSFASLLCIGGKVGEGLLRILTITPTLPPGRRAKLCTGFGREDGIFVRNIFYI